MRIWVDADACPAVIKDILYRAAERTQRSMTLVANSMLPVKELKAGDLMITGTFRLPRM